MSRLRPSPLPVGDEAPVLHGAGAEVGDGDHVLLGQRVGHVEVVLKVPKHLGSDALRVGNLGGNSIALKVSGHFTGQLLVQSYSWYNTGSPWWSGATFVYFIFEVPQCCPTALQFLPN